MQALVKTPRTDIRIQGDIPERILDVLKSEYGGHLKKLAAIFSVPASRFLDL